MFILHITTSETPKVKPVETRQKTNIVKFFSLTKISEINHLFVFIAFTTWLIFKGLGDSSVGYSVG